MPVQDQQQKTFSVGTAFIESEDFARHVKRDYQCPDQSVRYTGGKWVKSTEKPRPAETISFGAMNDPKLRIVCPIELKVIRDAGTVSVVAREIDEFGHGPDLSSALDDFRATLTELFNELQARSEAELGPDLRRVWEFLSSHIAPRAA